MSATTLTTRLEPETVPADLLLRRFTVDEYHRMIEAGIITPEHRVELLEGWIVEKMGQNPPHSNLVRILNRWFVRNLPDEYLVSGQLPVTLADQRTGARSGDIARPGFSLSKPSSRDD